mmetsp:Transcript_14791/g.40922  ORF Transcript_14791/g.40922 Transcript_14791/m.40922 type:complete len:420 (-) Transcript_14791:1525-2784(-)|eukprot:CAMPEP_0198128896 /NCGR_PEP_ID=MMETSP1442-20131203/50403_1 /TAXON_ID= /ORGANISM="Craspedostauros australis, Strain CCMP3328" /LENGTH=419 /DNA_ID=CAMNT_0043789151 /DNA_START=274 /DNA_END=1533 /DNA_ORIENTATION=+
MMQKALSAVLHLPLPSTSASVATTAAAAVAANRGGGGPNSLLKVTGRSWANDGTSFVVPQLGWVLDCGAIVQPGFMSSHKKLQKHVFITHTHADHVSSLTKLLFSGSSSFSDTKSKHNIYLPKSAVPQVDAFLKSFIAMATEDSGNESNDECDATAISNVPPDIGGSVRAMTHGGDQKQMAQQTSSLPYRLVGCEPGDVIQIGKSHKASIVECDHRLDCVGYSFVETKRMFKPEFEALPRAELGQLCRTHRKEHGNLDDLQLTLEQPTFCFLGDTTPKVFQTHPEILDKQKIIFVECTYLDGPSQNANKYKHIHWDDLEPIVTSHPSTMFVLMHFSLRYSPVYIREFFSRYDNVHPMLVDEELQEAWTKKLRNEDGNVSETHAGDVQQGFASPPSCQCIICQQQMKIAPQQLSNGQVLN